ncbi:MAG: C-terminal binding protein, partial [Planctomycetes bacterium]|nr:C-terminal binding protein [Planctomycetota bacterium]
AAIVSLPAPLPDETRHVFHAGVFQRMKNTAMLINVSRGELVNQDHLVQALRAGEIGFAGLDVFAREPLPVDSPLIGMENVVLTPHTAFYGADAGQNQIALAIDLVVAALTENRLPERYIANPAAVSKMAALTIIR